jgi:hypothetical protein
MKPRFVNITALFRGLLMIRFFMLKGKPPGGRDQVTWTKVGALKATINRIGAQLHFLNVIWVAVEGRY